MDNVPCICNFKCLIYGIEWWWKLMIITLHIIISFEKLLHLLKIKLKVSEGQYLNRRLSLHHWDNPLIGTNTVAMANPTISKTPWMWCCYLNWECRDQIGGIVLKRILHRLSSGRFFSFIIKSRIYKFPI